MIVIQILDKNIEIKEKKFIYFFQYNNNNNNNNNIVCKYWNKRK